MPFYIYVFSSAALLCVSHSNVLNSAIYQENGCLTKVAPAKNLKEAFISKIATWYMPMASSFWYHTWVERLTNHSATPEKLKKLCLKLLFLASKKATVKNAKAPYLIAAGGLNRVLTYDCMSTSLQGQSCDAIPGTPGFTAGIETEEVIVHTDNKNYILLVQCVKKKFKSWYVLSPSETPPAEAEKKDVLQVIGGLGFNKKFAAGIPYAGCPKPKPGGKPLAAQPVKPAVQPNRGAKAAPPKPKPAPNKPAWMPKKG